MGHANIKICGPREDLFTIIMNFSKMLKRKYGSLFWLVGLIIVRFLILGSMLYLVITKRWKGVIDYIKRYGKNWLKESVPPSKKEK